MHQKKIELSNYID